MSASIGGLQAPDRKISAGAVASAGAVLITWIIETTTHVDIPVGVEGAIATIVYFVTGYIVPPSDGPQPPEPSPSPPE